MGPEGCKKMNRRAGASLLWRQAELEVLSLKKRRLQGDSSTAFEYLEVFVRKKGTNFLWGLLRQSKD